MRVARARALYNARISRGAAHAPLLHSSRGTALSGTHACAFARARAAFLLYARACAQQAPRIRMRRE